MRLAPLVLFATLGLAACGATSTNVATTATPTPSGSLGAASAEPSSPASTTLPRCHTADLEIAVAQVQGAAGTIYVTFEFRDAADHDCTMFGYPGTAMIDLHGHQLHTNAIRTPDYPNHPGGPTLVTLRAGSAALGGDHKDHAITLFSFSDNACPAMSDNTPQQWQVTPPDETTSLFAPARKGDASTAPVCNGDVKVRPVAPPDYLAF